MNEQIMNKFHSFSHMFTSFIHHHHGFYLSGSSLPSRIMRSSSSPIFTSFSRSFSQRGHLSNRALCNLLQRSFSYSLFRSYRVSDSKKQTQSVGLLLFRFQNLHGTGVFRKSTASPFSVNQKVSQDTLIFSHNNDNFFKFLSIFGVVQMFMWGYLSLFSVQELRSGPVIKKDTSNLPWWQKMLYTEGRYKNAISSLCFIVGASIFFITLTYPRRAVRKLWLLKGGKDVKITSYSWFGQTYTFKIPLEHINCIQSRSGTGSQVPFKIKDKYFFFLLDKQGNFHNPELFDFVIGLQRNIK